MFSEIVTLFIMAFALGMDAFSLAIGMGMLGLRLRQIFNIGVTIGIFHVIMPLAGIIIGKFLSLHLGVIATYIGGGLLIFLGAQMCISSLRNNDDVLIRPAGYGLLLFAISVSLDSFSVGLSLGLFGAKTIIVLMAFGLMSMCLTWVGLLMGKYMKGWIGSYGEILGGLILLAFGIKLLLPV
ncbi:manganese efflux pump MntP family protein [Anaerobacillus sp. MEB173]|uniref:manganese efflux pump MntP n=1 Tax=Anaerobacillus sp. MEB173 TaxID=3383345 RepID=UPI003F9317ED